MTCFLPQGAAQPRSAVNGSQTPAHEQAEPAHDGAVMGHSPAADDADVIRGLNGHSTAANGISATQQGAEATARTEEAARRQAKQQQREEAEARQARLLPNHLLACGAFDDRSQDERLSMLCSLKPVFGLEANPHSFGGLQMLLFAHATLYHICGRM